MRKSDIIEGRVQTAGQEWGEWRAAAFLLIARGSQATLAVPLLEWCYTGTGGREATHSLDLSLITAYLVVNNSTSAETHGRDEDDVTPDGCLVPFVPPCGSEAPQHGSAAWGQWERIVESVLHSPLSSPLAANSLFPGIKCTDVSFFLIQ